MKKNIFILTAMAALMLSGCANTPAKDNSKDNSSDNNGTADAGTVVDIAGEEGKSALKASLLATKHAYESLDLTSLGVKSTTSEGKLNLKASYEVEEMGKMSAEIDAKNLGGVLEAKMAKAQDNTLAASVEVKDTTGSLTLKGSFPSAEEEGKNVDFTSSLSLAGFKAAAYLSGDTVYADVSDSSVAALVAGVDKFAEDTVNGLVGTVLDGMAQYYLADFPFFDVETNEFYFTEMFNGMLPESKKIAVQMEEAVPFPTMSEASDDDLEGLDEFVTSISEMGAAFGLSFKTFKDGGFAFDVNLGAEQLIALVSTFVTDPDAEGSTAYADIINSILSEFSIKASAKFSKGALLESIEASCAVAAALTEETATALIGTPLELSLALGGKEKVEISYNNVSVNLPSDLESYQPIALGVED